MLPDFIEQETHGQPPNRECLKGSDEKWEGYLLGVEEAKHAAQGWIAARTLRSSLVDDERHEYLMVFRERDRYRAALQEIAQHPEHERFNGLRLPIGLALKIAREALLIERGDDMGESQWRCGDCRCLNGWHESFCYRCGAGQPE